MSVRVKRVGGGRGLWGGGSWARHYLPPTQRLKRGRCPVRRKLEVRRDVPFCHGRLGESGGAGSIHLKTSSIVPLCSFWREAKGPGLKVSFYI